MRALFTENLFDTPKPERLLERVIALATQSGDLVLDSFAGSGTTGAVAHKMGRRWIMIELGEHCHTHIIPRLQKVVSGADKGGITEAVNWQGGGFRYYKLAPSLIVNDRWGNPVINPDMQNHMDMIAHNRKRVNAGRKDIAQFQNPRFQPRLAMFKIFVAVRISST